MRITGKPGLITSLVGFDDISTIPDGTYNLIDNATGTGGTVTMSGGAIASFTPGSNYSLGDVYAEGYGNRFTVASIVTTGARITSSVLSISPTGTNIANDGTFGVFRPNDSNWGYVEPGWNVVGHPELGKVVSAVCDIGDQYTTTVTTTANNFVYGTQYSFEKRSGLRFVAAAAAPSGTTITIPDLSSVVSGPVSGSTYTNGGGYDYVVFGSTPTLTGAIITQYGITPDNSGFFGPHPVTWSAGSDSTSGYVYLQVTSTSDFQFYSSDVDGNPVAGTWVFPMTFV